jgi:small GTP-binding protein
VGKTSLCKKFARDEFDQNEDKTIGSDFYSKTMKVSKGLVAFTLWDLSGDVVYSEVRNEFYKDSHALFIVYDSTNRKSFDAIDMWLREVSKYGGDNLPVVVVASKV